MICLPVGDKNRRMNIYNIMNIRYYLTINVIEPEEKEI